VPTTQSLSCDSAIGLHLLRKPIRAQNYDDKQFSNLILCRQKELSAISRCSRIKSLFLNFSRHLFEKATVDNL